MLLSDQYNGITLFRAAASSTAAHGGHEAAPPTAIGCFRKRGVDDSSSVINARVTKEAQACCLKVPSSCPPQGCTCKRLRRDYPFRKTTVWWGSRVDRCYEYYKCSNRGRYASAAFSIIRT